MTHSTTLIGHLTDIQGQSFTARLCLEGGASGIMVQVDGEEVLVGQLSSHVAIRQQDIHILATVTRMQTVPGASDTAGGQALELLPLGEVDAQGQFQRGIRHFPAVGAEVHAVGSNQVRVIFEQHRDKGFSLGHLHTHPDLEVCLDPGRMFGRHFAILGQSGSGKSWTVASLLQRTIQVMPKAHVILLDLHGEYCWHDDAGNLQSAFDPAVMHYVDARQLEIPYWLMTYAELIDLLIDRDDPHASTQIALLRETVRDLKKKANPELFAQGMSIDSPVYFSLVEMYQYFKAANSQKGDFGKSKGVLFGHFDEFLVKLQSRFNDSRYDFLLKPKLRTHSNTLAGLLREFVGLGDEKRQITVIDLSAIPFDVRPTISAQIGRLAFEFNYWNPRYQEFPLLLVCEEAHTYIPRAHNTRYEGTRLSMERIAKEGRKYGVSLGVVSQRPHELSETVLSQCGTFLCMRMTNPDDQRYIRELVPEGERDLINILAALGRGEVMALGEAVPLATRFQFRRPDPTPRSEDVDYFQHWRSGPDDLDVDEIVQRWRLQRR
ncbi:MAG: DUF87 domain-containing protein [Xanthomonadaceae bacterium]|nr:DUF87 domain-containing protein [Xanthomonadaceae bacterium]